MWIHLGDPHDGVMFAEISFGLLQIGMMFSGEEPGLVIPQRQSDVVVFAENEFFKTQTVGFGVKFVVGAGFNVVIGRNDPVDGITQQGDIPEGTMEIAVNSETAMTVYASNFLPLDGGQFFQGFLVLMGRISVDLVRTVLSVDDATQGQAACFGDVGKNDEGLVHGGVLLL